ncbi:MAG TPA: LUD domain-containing protein, partial [Bacteroidales bacterium]|nr:LUD domain-containing protein [Bacteroidales bacterium]
SIVMSSKLHGGRNSYSMPDVHIVIGYASQVVREIKHALQEIKTRYSSPPSLVTFVTGPSRTGDIEKTLVMGAHGPKELYLLFIDDRE